MSSTATSPLKQRPNVLAGSGGRQFSFGRPQLHPRQASSPVLLRSDPSPGPVPKQIVEEDLDDTSKSPFTYALHVVFTSFVRIAEKKINQISGSPNEPEPDVTALLGHGADPAFDKVLQSLGYIARQNPKPVIDSVMFWRKSRSELKNENSQPLNAGNIGTISGNFEQPALQRRTTDPVRPSFVRSPSSLQTQADPRRTAAIQLDRKSLVSIFILCRTLIEIVKQINSESLGDEVGEKLEEIVFNQLKNADPESLLHSPLRLANWNLFAELLGCLSGIRFASVSDRFVADLERSGRGVVPKDNETRVEMMIHGMRHLKVRIYPVSCLEESAEFLSSLANFFLDAHGHRIKQAYAEVLHHLILPVSDTATAEVNFPAWSQTIRTLYPRAAKMLEKTRYWTAAFPLATSLLCVAPREMFIEKWSSLVEQNLAKIKDRQFRNDFIQGMTRLVWVAIFRCIESQNIFLRKIDLIFKAIFPTNKRAGPAVEAAVPIIQMIRYVGLKHMDYCLNSMLLSLIGNDHFYHENSPIDFENLYPERVTIATRAFLHIMEDLEDAAQRPAFPVSFEQGEYKERAPRPKPLKAVKSQQMTEFYDRFSSFLYRIAFFCDQHFGLHLTPDDRTPAKTAFAQFETSLNINGVVRDKQQYHDLFAAVLDALPSCLSSSTPVPKVVEMICKATAHADPGVRNSARRSLRTIAMTGKVQSIVVGYARVMLKFDAQNPSATEEKLRLYIELLNIWIQRIQNKAKESDLQAQTNEIRNGPEAARGEEMEILNIWAVVEETEAHGLFFLCNQSRSIRKQAIEILRLVRRFDVVMDEQVEATKNGHTRKASKSSNEPGAINRLIDILIIEGPGMLESTTEQASVAERSRTMKLMHDKAEDSLIKVAESESGVDAAIWFKVFPHLIRLSFEKFPITVVLCRNLICHRLLKLQSSIINAIENLKAPSPFDVLARANAKISTSPESIIEQWKLFLITACTTLTLTDEQVPDQVSKHGRKRSVPVATFERITSARSLFQIVLPMLSADHTAIREAIVIALGCININLYKVLLEDLQPMMRALADISKQRLSVKSGALRNSKKLDRLRTEITHILQLTSHFLSEDEILNDQWILETLSNFLKDVKNFLSDDEVQIEWEYQRLRRYFCGLLEAVWEGLQASSEPNRWLPFEGRVSCFRLIEEWCNHGPHQSVARNREELMRQSILNTYRDNRDRGALTASMEIEKRNVEYAALSAMACLCKGSVIQKLEGSRNKKATISFEIDSLFAWIAAVFGSNSEKIHSVGRRALTNLLRHNLDFTELYQEAVHQCYTHDFDSKSARSYFTVLAEVLTEQNNNPCGLSQLLALCLFKAGDKNCEIRGKTLDLLKATEMRFYGRSCVDSFTASVVNQNPVIYKQGQYLLAAQIAKDHEEQKFLVFSECTNFFRLVETRLQRDVVAILLPWVQSIELQLDVDGEELDSASQMVLVNLFEITIRFSDALLHEIEGLWTALITGPFIGNVKAILDFTITQSVARREALFVTCGKQVIVYLSRSPAGTKLVEALLAYLQPRSMVPQIREPLKIDPSEQQFTYIADLDRVFQDQQQKHVVFSLGQLALIFMVDLLVVPAPEVVPQVPTLLLVIFILLDHYTPLVQDQARELFVYLTHNLCIERISELEHKRHLQKYLQDFRSRRPDFTWAYDDLGSFSADDKGTPATLESLVTSTLDIYAEHFPNIRDEWGKIALNWATSCPVRHMACRAFQVFRCLSSPVDQNILADMLARLSNTIADSSSDIQAFAMEILRTLNIMVQNMNSSDLLNYPQILWATIASLSTIHEEEFSEALTILDHFMTKIDLGALENVNFFTAAMPPKWEGRFNGITELLLKGLRSDLCMQKTIRIINRMITIPSNAIVGGDSRLQFCLLANLPFLVHALKEDTLSITEIDVAENLAKLSDTQGLTGLSRVCSAYAKSKFRSAEDFVRQVSSSVRTSFFPEWEAQFLVFLLGQLSNRSAWMKICTMDLLKAILPFVDTRRPEFAGVGADLISPLLRLLQTDYAQAGLEVLDKAISISGGPKDRQVLRMSLGNRTIRKEYEKTATLFGIPEESGWAVAMPANSAMTTRANVHAVFYTCAVTVQNQEMPDNVQFHMEDYAYHPPSERSETMLSVEGAESTLGDMVSALHNLDVFFAEDVEITSQSITPVSGDQSVEQAPASVYDSRVAAILSRSLARTPSMSSFTSPGFDTSPKHERKSSGMERSLGSPTTANGFSFPRQARLPIISPRNPRSPGLSIDSDSGAEESQQFSPSEVLLSDDRSEASFKLEGQLKKSGSTMKSMLWSNRDPERIKEKELRKKDKVLKINTKGGKVSEPGPASPSNSPRGYFWSSSNISRT